MNDEELLTFLTRYAEKEFGGDVEKMRRSLDAMRKDVLDWNTLYAGETYLPWLSSVAEGMILRRLGWLPREELYKSHELFIRSLVYRYITDPDYRREEFHNDVDTHIKHIRNADMKDCRCVERVTHEQIDLDYYEEYLAEFKEPAQRKIRNRLGYTPDILYSLDPELFLREFLSTLKPHQRDIETPIECRAASMIRYRELYLKMGMEAADTSPLVGIPWDSDGMDSADSNFLN